MEIIKTKKVQGCLEATNSYDIVLSEEISKNFILHLGNLGKLIFKENFEKPFFKIIVKGKYSLKGSQFNKSMRILLPDKEDDSWRQDLEEIIKNFKKI